MTTGLDGFARRRNRLGAREGVSACCVRTCRSLAHLRGWMLDVVGCVGGLRR